MRRFLADTTPLRESPAFARLWWGLGVSNLGAQLTVVAVGLEVYAMTSSTFAVGILGLCALVPLVILGLYGGALVDAYDRRKVAIFASSALWLVTVALAVQAWAGVDEVWVLYLLVALQSAAFAINNPARSAIIPRLVPIAQLPAANALMGLLGNTAMTLGPLLGALLVARWGYATAYAVDAVLFTAALWALVRLPDLPPTEASERVDAARRRRVGLGSVLEGLRYLATQPNVRMTFLVDLAAMIFAMPRVLFPAIGVVIIGGGEGTTGILTAGLAIGGVLAGLFSGGLTRINRQGLVIVWSIVGWGLSVTAFGLVLVAAGRTEPTTVLTWALVLGFAALVLCGITDGVSAVFRTTILQAAAPDEMRGRLQGVFIVVVAGGPRLADVLVGAEATWWGEGMAAVVGGLTCIAVLGLLVWRQPRFLAYDARHPEP